MIKGYAVIVAHIVQLMTYSRKQPSAGLYGTDIPDIWFPLDIIISQASAERAFYAIEAANAVRLLYHKFEHITIAAGDYNKQIY